MKKILLFVLSTLLLASCFDSNNSYFNSDDSKTTTKDKFEAEKVFESYIKINNAIINSDYTTAVNLMSCKYSKLSQQELLSYLHIGFAMAYTFCGLREFTDKNIKLIDYEGPFQIDGETFFMIYIVHHGRFQLNEYNTFDDLESEPGFETYFNKEESALYFRSKQWSLWLKDSNTGNWLMVFLDTTYFPTDLKAKWDEVSQDRSFLKNIKCDNAKEFNNNAMDIEPNNIHYQSLFKRNEYCNDSKMVWTTSFKNHKIGYLTIGDSIAPSLKKLKEDFIISYDTTFTCGVFDYFYSVMDNTKRLIFTIHPTNYEINNGLIDYVILYDKTYKSDRGIGIGNSALDLKNKYDINEAYFDFENGLFFFASDFEGSFRFECCGQENLNDFYYIEPTIETVPDDMVIDMIVIR